MTKLSTYDPDWEQKHSALHAGLASVWRQAVHEKKVERLNGLRPGTRQQYVSTIARMRHVRKFRYETVADYACNLFNRLSQKAYVAGVALDPFPDPQDITSLRDVRMHCAEALKKIKVLSQENDDPSTWDMTLFQAQYGARLYGGSAACH